MVEKEKFKVVREALGKNQTDFAAVFGVKQNTYSTYESGKEPFPDYFFRILRPEFNINQEWWDSGKGPIFIERQIIENEANKTSIEASVWKIKFEHEEAKCKWFEVEIELLQDHIATLKENILLLKEENKTLREKVRT